jgi:hypothetical protein
MNRKAYASILALVLVAFAFLPGCSSSHPPQVVLIAATSGSGQSATVGAAFTNPLVATVTKGGSPESGVTVTFTAPAQTGASGTFAGGVSTATTNASGVATSAVFTANTFAGAYTVTAAATGASTPASFSLTNTAGAAATITATSGSGQSALISTAFTNPLVATVVDSDSNPVSGATVTFAAPAAGASGTFAGGANTATTNASGVATSAVFTANATAGGPYTVTATVGVLAPANFSLTNTAAVESITATSGGGQSALISTAFTNPLVATVSTGGVGNVGVVVTFTAPASGASGTFASTGTNTETQTTIAGGVATSSVFTANATAGGPYNVTATATGAVGTPTFALTNTAVVVGSNNYSFYLSGADILPPPASNGNYNFYALAGSVTINSSGTVVGGVQDYNDAFGFTSPQPAGDTITGGTLTVNATGQGTLTLITNNTALGVNGTETLAVQFVNTNHALIAQFDGTATSSGSMDLQTLPSTLSGGYALTLSGVDKNYSQNALGGVFTITGTAVSGFIDQNDAGTVTTNQAFTATISAADGFGRGTLSITGSSDAINYYIVGPEVIRIIDVDTAQSGVGSAFGQGDGVGSFGNTSLASPSVLAVAGNPWISGFATLGQFSTSNTSSNPADFAGVADVNELISGIMPVEAAVISGTYSIGSNGYGSLTITPGDLQDVSALGVYVTDPALNLNDPNNTATGGGGALVLDLDPILAGSTGVLIPQTDTTTAHFTGNYAVGWQDFNNFIAPACGLCEFDFVGQGSVTAGALSGTGVASDPFFTLGQTTATISGIAFSGTPAADGANPGRYSMSGGTASQFNWFGGVLDLDIYQASGGQLFWLNWDQNTVFLGPLEQQGSLAGLPAAARSAAKTKAKRKQ